MFTIFLIIVHIFKRYVLTDFIQKFHWMDLRWSLVSVPTFDSPYGVAVQR